MIFYPKFLFPTSGSFFYIIKKKKKKKKKKKTESKDVKNYFFKMVWYWSDHIMKVLGVEKELRVQHILEKALFNLHYFVALGTI